jgi:hypothetical protein
LWREIVPVVAASANRECLIVAPGYTGETKDETLERAAEAARLVPVRAHFPTTENDRDRLYADIHRATAILIDLRADDPFCHTALGMAVDISARVVLVLDDSSPIPFPVAHTQIAREHDNLSGKAKYEALEKEIAERLVAAAEQQVQEAITAATKTPHPARVPTETYSRDEAENLINALWADQLSVQSIRAEMIRVGVPESWLDLRLARLNRERRPGW